MKDWDYPRSLEICAAFSAFPSPFCLAYSPAGSWTWPRLHNLLSGISNINKLDLKWHLKSRMAKKNETNVSDSYSSVVTIHPWSPYRETREEKWRLGQALKPTREQAEQNGRGKEDTNLWGFVVLHAKPHQRKWQICNDLQWHNLPARLNSGLSHLPSVTLKILPTQVIYILAIGQAVHVSENLYFCFVFYFILGVVRREVCRGSPWTSP